MRCNGSFRIKKWQDFFHQHGGFNPFKKNMLVKLDSFLQFFGAKRRNIKKVLKPPPRQRVAPLPAIPFPSRECPLETNKKPLVSNASGNEMMRAEASFTWRTAAKVGDQSEPGRFSTRPKTPSSAAEASGNGTPAISGKSRWRWNIIKPDICTPVCKSNII